MFLHRNSKVSVLLRWWVQRGVCTHGFLLLSYQRNCVLSSESVPSQQKFTNHPVYGFRRFPIFSKIISSGGYCRSFSFIILICRSTSLTKRLSRKIVNLLLYNYNFMHLMILRSMHRTAAINFKYRLLLLINILLNFYNFKIRNTL